MNIYTIIVTYNAMQKQWIDRCLKSLENSTIQTTAIIIDNDSTDGTRDYVPTKFPTAIWLPQEKNLGFGQANNVGIKWAMEHNADYVLLLNQDAALHPKAIEYMLEESDSHSLLSPLHLNGDGSRIDKMFHSSLRNANNTMDDDLLIRHHLKDSYETGEICAACWLLPRRLLEEIGGFNPLFFHYSEDSNYYHRTVYHKIKTILVPQAIMYHDRILQGNMQAYNNKRIERDILLPACNINLSFGQCVREWLKVLYSCYAKELPQHTYTPGTYILSVIHIICKCKRILNSRKAEKVKGKTWL